MCISVCSHDVLTVLKVIGVHVTALHGLACMLTAMIVDDVLVLARKSTLLDRREASFQITLHSTIK